MGCKLPLMMFSAFLRHHEVWMGSTVAEGWEAKCCDGLGCVHNFLHLLQLCICSGSRMVKHELAESMYSYGLDHC